MLSWRDDKYELTTDVFVGKTEWGRKSEREIGTQWAEIDTDTGRLGTTCSYAAKCNNVNVNQSEL